MAKSKIQVLDDLTIQKIAAGEVIDNPASVVKEMVENSIDAGSKNIVVEIKKGGKELIRITDDGGGMSREDINLAFKRHSTSKLRDVNDIYSITSLGFRGEALASISSIARVEVLTKSADAAAGSQALVEEGLIKSLDSVGTPKGTTMLIKDIFYNLPVRKKFLKTNRSEANYINNVVSKMALGNPEIGFKFIRDNKLIIQTKSNDSLINTIYTILGRDYANNLIDVDYEDDYIKLSGYISNNQLYRGNRGHQYLYINGRYILNPAISRAIENRYRSLIPRGRFPAYVLNLEIDPGEIDVNIHPTKQEIKFTNPDRVIGTISNRVEDYIKQSLNIPMMAAKANDKEELPDLLEIEIEDLDGFSIGKGSMARGDALNDGKSDQARGSSIEIDLYKDDEAETGSNLKVVSNDYLKESLEDEKFENQEEVNGNIDLTGFQKENRPIDEIDISDFFKEIGLSNREEDSNAQDNTSHESEDNYSLDDRDLSSIKDSDLGHMGIDIGEDSAAEEGSIINEELLELEIVGRVFNTYIIAQDKLKDTMFFVDQHAAHERVMYERYSREFKDEKIAIQQLMIPEIVELSYSDMEIYLDNEKIFENLGFDIGIFGDNSLSIRGVPLVFGNPESKAMFIEILDNIHESLDTSYDLKAEKIMKIACVNAIKSGDEMGDIEIEALFEQLIKCENPYTCPHGRPTIIEMTKKQLEQEFLRIM